MPSLAGQRIVVTRAPHQAEELARPLRALGADVLLLPLLGIADPLDPSDLIAGATNCNSYDWIIFSSANAVIAFAKHVQGRCEAQVAVVGEATREEAESRGFQVAVTPEKYVAESLLEAMGKEDLAQRRILIPSAAVTRDVIPEALRQLGAVVEVVEAYRTILPAEANELVPRIFRSPLPDWITFASPSAVNHAVELVGTESLRNIAIGSIGPITTSALERHGLCPRAEADPHTIDGLVAAIVRSDMIRPQESN
jgi:uroporphyrinogen-III synthase